MNASDIRLIAEAMRDCGITHLKTHDLEMFSKAHNPIAPLSSPVEPTHSPIAQPETISEPLKPEDEEAIKHKIEAFESIMKLSDEALTDRLFPEPEAPKDDE